MASAYREARSKPLDPKELKCRGVGISELPPYLLNRQAVSLSRGHYRALPSPLNSP